MVSSDREVAARAQGNANTSRLCQPSRFDKTRCRDILWVQDISTDPKTLKVYAFSRVDLTVSDSSESKLSRNARAMPLGASLSIDGANDPTELAGAPRPAPCLPWMMSPPRENIFQVQVVGHFLLSNLADCLDMDDYSPSRCRFGRVVCTLW